MEKNKLNFKNNLKWNTLVCNCDTTWYQIGKNQFFLNAKITLVFGYEKVGAFQKLLSLNVLWFLACIGHFIWFLKQFTIIFCWFVTLLATLIAIMGLFCTVLSDFLPYLPRKTFDKRPWASKIDRNGPFLPLSTFHNDENRVFLN